MTGSSTVEKWTSYTDNALTTVFLDSRLWKTKQPRKRLQNFRQSCVLSTDRIEIHQSQPLVWPSDLLYVMLAGCDWWISIRSVDNMCDWRKFRKRFRGCFVFESRESRKTVVNPLLSNLMTVLSSNCFLLLSLISPDFSWCPSVGREWYHDWNRFKIDTHTVFCDYQFRAIF